MDDELRELHDRMDVLNVEAMTQRRERDSLNDMARRWVAERDSHNAQLREYLNKANEMKQLREEHNKAVKEHKVEREKWAAAVSELSAAVNAHKRHMKGIPIFKLEKDLQALEFRQMTSVLSVEDEREVIKSLSRLKAEIRKAEEQLMKDPEFVRLSEELKNAKKELKRYVKLVEESAEKAQEAHREMVRLFENCDAVRAKGDDAQANFLKVKAQADVYHKNYIEAVKQIHELERTIGGLAQKDKKTRISEDQESVKREAETIFEKFKKGEKLSTEDIMTLQKSGYI